MSKRIAIILVACMMIGGCQRARACENCRGIPANKSNVKIVSYNLTYSWADTAVQSNARRMVLSEISWAILWEDKITNKAYIHQSMGLKELEKMLNQLAERERANEKEKGIGGMSLSAHINNKAGAKRPKATGANP